MFLEKVSNVTKDPTQGSCSADPDLDPGPPTYKAEMLTT
jgi:hypothetical protein